MTRQTAQRERYHFLAQYYAWIARGPRPTLPGNDPITGQPRGAWNPDPAMTRIARAAYIAMAREAYAVARSFGPTPLP